MSGVTAAEKAAILDHYKTTVESFDAAAKQAILGHLQQQLATIGEPGEDIEELLWAIESCCIALGRAERVLRTGDIEAGRDIVRSAAAELAEMV